MALSKQNSLHTYRNRHLSNSDHPEPIHPMYCAARTRWVIRPTRTLPHSRSHPVLDITCPEAPKAEANVAAAQIQDFSVTPTKIRTSQSVQTTTTEDSVAAVSSTPTLITTCESVFPPITFRYQGYLNLASSQRTPFAQYPVSHFPDDEWEKIWNRRVINLDLHASSTNYSGSDKQFSPKTTYFHFEHEFVEYAYRVIVNPITCPAGLTIKRGTAVDICGINGYDGRYVVDYCQLVRDGVAYLPVHYRQYDSQGFSSAFDPRHLSFILVIPTSFCFSPLLPHLDPSVAILDNPTTLPSDVISSLISAKRHSVNLPPAKATDEDKLPRRTWWKYFFCCF